MAKNENQKLREKSREELTKEIASETKNLQELRFDLARGKVKNSAIVRGTRRHIARLLTFVNEKEKIQEEIKSDGGK